jgi:hypothetical protein
VVTQCCRNHILARLCLTYTLPLERLRYLAPCWIRTVSTVRNLNGHLTTVRANPTEKLSLLCKFGAGYSRPTAACSSPQLALAFHFSHITVKSITRNIVLNSNKDTYWNAIHFIVEKIARLRKSNSCNDILHCNETTYVFHRLACWARYNVDTYE